MLSFLRETVRGSGVCGAYNRLGTCPRPAARVESPQRLLLGPVPEIIARIPQIVSPAGRRSGFLVTKELFHIRVKHSLRH